MNPNPGPRSKVALLIGAAMLVFAGSSLVFAHFTPPATAPAAPNARVAEGVAALDRYDYGTARRIFAALAQDGNPQAEIWLGRMDQEGLGGPANGSEAIAWYGKAAQSGAAEAERRLGELYLHGALVLQDVGQARHWLELAANHHDAAAAHDLGSLYASGLGMAKDPKQAYAWLSIAASTGDRSAAAARDRLLASLPAADAAQAQSLAQATLRSVTAPPAAPPVATAMQAPAPTTPAS
jgi:TPR repeat protein